MEKNKVFVYDWYLDEKVEDSTAIRIYSLDEENNTVCLRVNDFTPFVYLELPENVDWTATLAQMLGNEIDKQLKNHKPINKCLMYKHKLYGAHINNKGQKKKFPYLFCSFATKTDIFKLSNLIRKKVNVPGLGNIIMKMHEQDASAILQMVSYIDIPTAGWIIFSGKKVSEEEKITLTDKEYIVKFKNIAKYDRNTVGKPKIMGFDIEVNSSNPAAMPKSDKPNDKIFQISCVFTREGGSEEDYDIYLLSLGEPNPEKVGENVTIHMYETESDLLEGFTDLVRTENPNIISGYNILGFDIQYMIERAKFNYCIGEFDRLGFHKYNHCKEKLIKWSSSAYKDQEFLFLEAEGRIIIDLLPLIKRDFKLDNYKLKTVSELFIGDTKNDLSVKGIFKCYRIGTKKEDDGSYSQKAKDAMGKCGLYCTKDSLLVVKLMEKLQTWVGLCEMSKTVSVPMFALYTQGQQLKVFSQVYRYCLHNNIIVEKDGYITKENERYVGAYVFPPVPGIYERVVPFDFCLTGDTLVTLSNGTSKRIDELTKDELVLGYNENGFQNFSSINGLQKKGLKETIKVYLQDGRTISCTPEHKFMLYDGTWCEAKDLKDKEVMCGIQYPEDIKYDNEKEWCLQVDGYKFTMNTDIEREKTLAFSRMLGYILSDGSIYENVSERSALGYRMCVEACFGTMIDAENFKNDINKISDVDVNIRIRKSDDEERKKKGVTLSITLPAKIARMIHSLEDIIIGKRSTQEMKLPKFVLKDDCPLSIIKEFLGGLYGGDGCAPCLSKNNFCNVSFKWTTIEKHINSMKKVFDDLKLLHSKFGIESKINEPIKIKYSKNSIKPKDYIENPRYDIQLSLKLSDTLIFNDIIGFNYCINKTCRLIIVSSYQKMCDETRRQHSVVLKRSIELIDKNIKNVFSRTKGQMTFAKCLKIAQDELLDNEPALNIYSLSSTNDIGYHRYEEKRHKDRDRKISLKYKKYFDTPIDYINKTNTNNWFSFNSKEKKYAVDQECNFIPSFKQKVIDIRPNGIQEVYDIEVDKVHNFLANGIVSHNCSLYPTTIIAYNIDFSTIVNDSDIPDEMCNVMTWRDCYGCKHDPKVIKKNELTNIIDKRKEEIKELRSQRDKCLDKFFKKQIADEVAKKVEELKPFTEERANVSKTISKNPMCDKRHYRFLKSIKGVIPTILDNLLDARKNTRAEMKNIKKEMSGLDSEKDKKKIEDFKLLLNVLDKRQLAYKVSCNSMYGAWGVRKGYLPFMPGAMCLSGDSTVSFSYGFTRKIKHLVNTNSLWSYNDGQIVSNGNGLKYNGKREVVKITLIDGRTLKCTPDHKIMTSNGWMEAGKLLSKHGWDGLNFTTNSEYSKVVVGVELPEDIVGDDEKNWKILDYSMDTPNNREKTLAFCRILGFILADGSISCYPDSNGKELLSCKASLSTLLDANIFTYDIKLLTGKKPKINNSERVEVKGDTFSVHVPKILTDKIVKLDGIPIGKRTHQPYTLPSFLFKTNCPLSVIREFLGGLFGGDGTSPSLSSSHPSFSPIQLGLTTIEKYKDDMADTMNKLCELLSRFGMEFWCANPRLARVNENLLPKDIEENPRWEYMVTTNSCFSLLFAQKIGFRYCSDKNNKLGVAASYQRYSDSVRNQHINIVTTASNMFNSNERKISIKDILIKARREVYENDIPLNEYASISKSTDINNHRSRPHSLKDFKLLRKFFPTAREYTKMVGCEHWFLEKKGSKKVYSMDREDVVSPCLYLDVVDVRYDGVEDVYDIVDVPEHSFFANGIAVHNCTTYMGRTNIEIVAKTIQEKYKGELVYGDSVTGDTPILCRINNKIVYRTIDNLPHSGWNKYKDEKEDAVPDCIEVWTEKGFTKIKKIIRHKTSKELFRVLTHTGIVDVTEDHGLLDLDANKISPKDIKVGSTLLTSDLPNDDSEYTFTGINEDLAFVMGLFYADGSCGCEGKVSTWALNNADRKLLERCETILNNSEKDSYYEFEELSFKILETMESSSVLKLVAVGKDIASFVKIWRELFYDKEKYKKVPDEILWSSKEVRQSFLDGYYAGDGDKDKNGYYRFDNKGKIGASGLYFLASSLGYNVSINIRKDKPDIYRLTCTKSPQRKKENVVKKIESLGNTEQYVYDLETESHHFSAGIGKLIVHNTDCVLATEPVLIKNGDMIDYKTVEELSDGNWKRINPNKEISEVKPGYQIWSDTGFTNIVNVVRCGVKKPLTRVLTHTGVVNCSDEHSLLRDNLESVKPVDVKIGDKLCTSELPLPIDTPKKPLYNNKITKEVIEGYIIPNFTHEGLTAEMSFVWGLFFADGSCGQYLCGNGYVKTTWAINKKDNKLLERACDILNRNEKTLTFKILDTVKSPGSNKLVAAQFSMKKEHQGTLSNFVLKYQELFYDGRKYKKIPQIIFNSPFEIRQSFFMGYYSGDGSKKDPGLTMSNKGAIGSAGLFYLMRSIGYQVSVNTRLDKVDIYKLTGSTPEKDLRYEANVVKKITPLEGNEGEYIYDIQTENHHFAAGVGQLVVHNSNYISFPHLKTAKETWDYAIEVADKISQMFPPPINL